MNVIIAGGGTGGHLFPGIAIAEEFRKRNGNTRILFIGTERGIEKKVLGKTGFELVTLDVEGIKGRGFLRSFFALLKVPGGVFQSLRIIRENRPDLVIGVGGYASGPIVLAAHIAGVATAIAEQNALPGSTNRILGKIADRVFLSFADTRRWFSKDKALITGNPIRTAFVSGSGTREASADRFCILVFGGSQGAQAINRAVLASLAHLEEIRKSISIMHQTGEKEFSSVCEAYRAAGVDAEVLPFIVDMAEAFARADLLICRAGATSIAEITASGKAAILIPFPFAVHDHQTKNAEVLARAGAAEMVPERELDGRRLAEIILKLYGQPETLRDMEEKSKALGHPRAAADIVDACMTLAGKRELRIPASE